MGHQAVFVLAEPIAAGWWKMNRVVASRCPGSGGGGVAGGAACGPEGDPGLHPLCPLG